MANEYVSAATLKSTLGITVSTYDTDITTACSAASRAIDGITSRRFWKDTDAASVRYYTPVQSYGTLQIDDLVTLTSVYVDDLGDGSFPTLLVANTDFVVEPLNAAAESPARPYTQLRTHPNAPSSSWPRYPRSVKVTGRFGWPSVPDEIVRATTILAIKLFKRQESPMGVVTVGPDDVAIRVAGSDPDVRMLVDPYRKMTV